VRHVRLGPIYSDPCKVATVFGATQTMKIMGYHSELRVGDNDRRLPRPRTEKERIQGESHHWGIYRGKQMSSGTDTLHPQTLAVFTTRKSILTHQACITTPLVCSLTWFLRLVPEMRAISSPGLRSRLPGAGVPPNNHS
jgi:hypothetical protein